MSYYSTNSAFHYTPSSSGMFAGTGSSAIGSSYTTDVETTASHTYVTSVKGGDGYYKDGQFTAYQGGYKLDIQTSTDTSPLPY